MRNVDLQVDTIPDMTSPTGAYFISGKNTITLNYKRNNEGWNKWIEGEATLTHEQKHRDNTLKGMHAWPVSPEQAYKLEMHNEISANIAELLSLRQKYLETGDISVFDDKGTCFHFYKNAILSGEIKPNSPYKEDFDKEMSLIVNGTSKMWQETFAPNSYVKDGVSNGVSHGDINGKYAKYHDQNYENGKKIAYTIGGVDFTKYMDKDVEIPEKGKTALKDALKNGISKPQNGYQSFLAKSCDFFGLRPDEKSDVLKAAQGEKGIAGRIAAPIVATLSAAMFGTYNRMKNAYHSVFPPKNEQTHPINTQKPQYREWKNKDGERVSPVQYRQILDMDKDIIQKPTKSYADERKNADKKNNIPVSGNNVKTQNLKEKIQKDKHSADKYQQQMIAMIQNMNKINGQQKSIDAQKTTNILYQKYGDNAYNLLLKAIQEPTSYSQIAGD